MLSVNNVNYSNNSFKGNEKQQSFETHAGLKTGVAMFGLTAPVQIIMKKSQSENKKTIETIKKQFGEEVANNLKQSGKKILYVAPVAAAITIGAGALVDKINNDEFKKSPKNKADASNKGALIGAVAMPILHFSQQEILKSPKVFSNNLMFISAAITGAIGGKILGMIADSFANSGKREYDNNNNKQ